MNAAAVMAFTVATCKHRNCVKRKGGVATLRDYRYGWYRKR